MTKSLNKLSIIFQIKYFNLWLTMAVYVTCVFNFAWMIKILLGIGEKLKRTKELKKALKFRVAKFEAFGKISLGLGNPFLDKSWINSSHVYSYES